MKRIFVFILLITLMLVPGRTYGQEWPELRLMFWNLENFFDYFDDGNGESDTEFSSRGPRHWTKKRFEAKCNSVAKTILWLAGEAGDLPDVVAFAEVENRFVLKRLVTSTALKKLDYEIVHYESPDPRGIDCALLYRSSRLELQNSKPCRVSAPDLLTRDILLAQFLTPSGDSLAVLVNHHPSKYGGGETYWRREIAVNRLKELSDSLRTEGWVCQCALGDFNDTSDNPLFGRLSPSLRLCRYGQPEAAASRYLHRGSIRFNGEWQLIDLCFVSRELAGSSVFRAVAVPFLTERDAAHSGDRPLRTYSGPRYLGGVSDHLPIIVTVFSEKYQL